MIAIPKTHDDGFGDSDQKYISRIRKVWWTHKTITRWWKWHGTYNNNWIIYSNFKCLRSKNRQKFDQFFNHISYLCKNCNPNSWYHTSAVGECLVDIRFAETYKPTLFTFTFCCCLVQSIRFTRCPYMQAYMGTQIWLYLHTLNGQDPMLEVK